MNQNQNQNQHARCGDGRLDPGEECDNGAENSDLAPDACRTSCRWAHCGDGVLDAEEECDSGFQNGQSPEPCRTDCTITVCGDGYVGGQEVCDDGAGQGQGTCREDCRQDLALCGDGKTDPGEECDLGALNSDTLPNTCRRNCHLPWCGDGVIDADELCDAGAENADLPDAACRTDCQPQRCGDGIADTGEVCDGADHRGSTCLDLGYETPEGLGCQANCSDWEQEGCGTCGNGVVEPNEECEGESVGTATCDAQGFFGGGVPTCVGCRIDYSTCCQDTDGDGYGPNCDLGLDCDDDAPGITGPCQANGCPQGFRLVPAGEFNRGCNPGDLDGNCGENAQPRHVVTLTQAYCIERTEVTVEAFRGCKDALVCTGEPRPFGSDYTVPQGYYRCNLGPPWTKDVYVPEPGTITRHDAPLDDHPINCVDWETSRQYCQLWMRGDLPTEAQWEKAARGGPNDNRKYPWGDVSPYTDSPPFCTRANCACNCPYGGLTVAVDNPTITQGESPYGVTHMAGNVAEWVLDWYWPTRYQACAGGCTDPVNLDQHDINYTRVARGGAAAADYTYQYVARRLDYQQHQKMDIVGFRCVWIP